MNETRTRTWKDITLSAEAQIQATNIQKENNDYKNKTLRLFLEGKGCSGFYYGVSYDETLEDDIYFKQELTTIVVDQDTIEFVEGSHIIWVDDKRGKGFLVENPNHKKFRGKFYKRKGWQDRLEQKKMTKV